MFGRAIVQVHLQVAFRDLGEEGNGEQVVVGPRQVGRRDQREAAHVAGLGKILYPRLAPRAREAPALAELAFRANKAQFPWEVE